MRKHNPQTAAQIRRLGVPLRKIGDGAFRTAYAIPHLNVVVKIPQMQLGACVYHAKSEIAGFSRVRRERRFSSIRKHLPKIYYHNYATGIVIMERLRTSRGSETHDHVLLREKMKRCFRARNGRDWGWDNFGFDKKGHIKIIDLGLS